MLIVCLLLRKEDVYQQFITFLASFCNFIIEMRREFFIVLIMFDFYHISSLLKCLNSSFFNAVLGNMLSLLIIFAAQVVNKSRLCKLCSVGF